MPPITTGGSVPAVHADAPMADLPPGLMISAPASGTGKTTVMLGLLRALSEDGLAVQPFKSGPDYIDPAFHRAAAGRASFNLDTWAMDGGLLDAIAAGARGADICIVEGSMGLYDGVALRGASGQREFVEGLYCLAEDERALVAAGQRMVGRLGRVRLGLGEVARVGCGLCLPGQRKRRQERETQYCLHRILSFQSAG